MKIITQASDTVTRRSTTSRSGKTELAENSFFSAFFGEHFHAFTQSTTTTSTRQQASRCVISKKWWRYMATMTMCYHFPHRARVLIIISKRRFSNQSTAAATAAVSYITHKLSLGLSELVDSWKRKSISTLRCDIHWAVVGLLPELRTYSYLAIKQGSGKRGMS